MAKEPMTDLIQENQKLKAENEKLKKDFSNFFDSSKIPEITKLTRQRDTLKKALESVSISSEKDEFLSDVEYRHRIGMIHFACTKALQEAEGME